MVLWEKRYLGGSKGVSKEKAYTARKMSLLKRKIIQIRREKFTNTAF